MALVTHSSVPPQGVVEFRDQIGTDLPYHWQFNLAQFVSMQWQSDSARVQLVQGMAFDLSVADADVLHSILTAP